MEALEIIDRYCHNINESNNLDEIFSAVQTEMSRIGFSYFAYILLTNPDTIVPSKRIWMTNYPDEWITRYAEKRYVSNDLVFWYAASAVRPFMWHEIRLKARFTKLQQRVFAECAEAGLRSGATVPISGPGNARATFSVSNTVDESEFAQVFARNRHEIQLIATYAHERIMELRLYNQPEPMKLTPNETEVLNWTAQGKTKSEIGQILSISEDTVKAHLKHIYIKLDVHNATHAVVKSLMLGIITP